MFYKETNFKETSIGRIPRDWEVVKLERIFSFKNGQRPKLLEAGKIPVYGANGIMGYTDEFLVDNDFTIVVGRVGASGEVHLAQGEIWVSDNAIYSESYERLMVYPPFVYYLLKFKGLSRFASKTTHPIITQTFLNNFQIQLPSTLEQQKIAEILSTVDEAIQKTNEIIAKTERLKKGLMQELLSKGLILGFMFDTNVFNAILNEHIDLERLPRNLKYYVTHIQYDEICSTQSEMRKRELLKIIEKVPNEVIATEGAVYGLSRYGMAKFMNEADAKLYDEMLRRLKELDEKAGKKKPVENQARDVLIALTSIKNCLILVTEDKNLKKVTEEFNGQAITFGQFQKGEYK
jgi:predicted nucleic acid-binding protein